MSNHDEKYFDVRTMQRYLKKGKIKQNEVDSYLKSLPNEEDNFELTSFDEDDLGLGGFSEEEMESMPPMSEEDIDNFDFLKNEGSENNE